MADSFDRATGDLWIGDVGQDAWEEVDVAPAGARGLDFGWRRWEGSHCFDPPTGCDQTGVTMPVTEYRTRLRLLGHRRRRLPRRRRSRRCAGAYLFSDYCSGTLWAIDAGLDGAPGAVSCSRPGAPISSFGVDEAGEVY